MDDDGGSCKDYDDQCSGSVDTSVGYSKALGLPIA
jgi:hypothetical protein